MLSSRLISSKTINCFNLIAIRGFKSEYSLERIYPESTLDVSKPKTISQILFNSRWLCCSLSVSKEIKVSTDKFSGLVPIDKMQITYSRSSGPGGQNVNKVNTKVEMRFHLASSDWIPELARQNLAKLHHNSITKEGFMVLKSDKTRMQTLNLADCMDKLRCYIREAEKPPPEIQPEKLALIKKRQERASAERLREKRHSASIRRMKNEGLDNIQF